ncbi:Rnh202p ASCRUDRAFT_77974 [Ascoidea rubescens DSM 1968]|uniref:Ribonuclease H2 subunit B n=1 Tax=Ascoidea rubescens DSM 1968 TaxID=1344418 RepID=A0A1D2V9U2_9ASCO|nr:hypothetical protein ASCRUDRAFT_77974 [Ascoidea rubescens DSM 1968]ODV58267.1 hypothetical protein ASCRUDRAFT_77974 [Ascoidea rubescens DSM 1968]
MNTLRDQPRVVILPTGDVLDDSRKKIIVQLPSPRNFSLAVLHLLVGGISGGVSGGKEALGACLYEIRKISGSNPHLSSINRVETKNSKAVKSLLVEHSKKSGDNGLILEDPLVYIATPCNIVYLLISFFVVDAKEDDGSRRNREQARYLTIEDILDSLEALIGKFSDKWSDNFNLIPKSMIIQKLDKICDQIAENEQSYYKFSIVKTLKYLQAKIENFVEVNNFPVSILNSIIYKKYYSNKGENDVNEDSKEYENGIPNDILNIIKTKYAINIFQAYLNNKLVDQLISKYYEKDFVKLDEYSRLLEQEKSKKLIAQKNINELNDSLSNDIKSFNKNNNKNNNKAKTTKKTATTKKVQVGKGALDFFFKK